MWHQSVFRSPKKLASGLPPFLELPHWAPGTMRATLAQGFWPRRWEDNLWVKHGWLHWMWEIFGRHLGGNHTAPQEIGRSRVLQEIYILYICVCVCLLYEGICAYPNLQVDLLKQQIDWSLGRPNMATKFPTRSQNKQPGWAAVGHFGVQLEQRTCQHCAFGHVSKPKDDTKVWSNHHWWIAGLVDSPKETARQEYQEQLVWRGRN